MLAFMFLHQLYLAATASEWANPLVYTVLGVEVICGGLVVGIGAARASDGDGCTVCVQLLWPSHGDWEFYTSSTA